MHIFNLTTLHFSEAVVSGTIPPEICEHTATIVEEEGIMLVFGGVVYDGGTIYKLDLTKMRWSSVNNTLYQRGGHSANRIEDSIYLFGGYKGYYKGYFNDIHRYNIKE